MLYSMLENDLMKLTWLSWHAQYDLDVASEDQAFSTSSFPNAPFTINVDDGMKGCSERTNITNIIMIGPPGSGKGTHGPYIRDALCICHLATGDMLREAIAAGTELGQTADAIMKRGELVPDDLVIGLIEEKLGSE